jgi:hypothetical protein
MKDEKLKKILFAISEENKKNEEGENIKIVLNSLIGENVKKANDLWFEVKEIKEDVDYYNIIISLIDLLLESLTSNQDVDIPLLAEKIVNVLKNCKYSEYYNLTRKIFLAIDQGEKSFYDIYCSVCCLGFKKNSLLHRELEYNLKDLSEYDQFQNSVYSKEFENFNYDNINIEFLNNFNDFIECILNGESNGKNINEIITKLTDKNNKEDNSKNEIVDKKNSLSNNKLISTLETNEIEQDSNNEEIDTTEKEIDKDIYEKFISNFKDLENEGNNISMKTFLLYNKRNHRLNGIILLRSKIKEQLKEFELISKSQKELLSYYCSIKENLIYILRLKTLINQIKSSSIINIKRKLIDLLVFYIIKKNEKFFSLNVNYSPNKTFLEKILNILQKKRRYETEEIQKKINDIEKLIQKKKSITNYHIKIENSDLKDIINFFSYYKKYYIFHLEKENELYKVNKLIFNENENEYQNQEIIIKNKDKSSKNSNQEINCLNLDYAFKLIFEFTPDYETNEITLSKELKSIKEEKKVKIDNIIDLISASLDKIIYLNDTNSEIPKFEIDKDEYFSKEAKDLIKKRKSEFDKKIKSINELLSIFEIGDNNFQFQQTAIAKIQEQLFYIVKKEFSINIDYFIEIDENKPGISVLYYFQYKFMKLKDLYQIIQHICKIYKNYIEKENLTIKEKLKKINQEANEINLLIKKEKEIKNGKMVYLDWKKKKHKLIKYETFTTKLFNALKGINEFKIDDEDELIVDEITSCWLIKNNLDEFVL